MKKNILRFAAALLALVILASILPASAADDPIILVAVNDSLPYDLSDSTMPFYSGGNYYVPYTIFENSNLRVYSSYNNTDKILTLYNKIDSISFYLNTLCSYDGAGTKYTMTALSKNGIVFVPVNFLCEKFKLVCTITVNTQYTVIRITNGNQSYTNDEFIIQARTLIDSKIEKYTTSSQVPDTNTGGNTGSTEPPEVTTTHGTAAAVIWVDVDSGDNENLEKVFSALDKHDVSAVFFLNASTEYDGDLLRRIYASGYRIGFRAQDAAALEEANNRLFEAVRTTTRYVYYTGTENIAALGYINCAWDRSYSAYAYASAIADSLKENRITIIHFDLSKTGVAMLRSLVTYNTAADGVKISYVGLRETMFD